MMRGHGVVAPDFGAGAEIISHGKTGLLYRTEKGRINALESAPQLNRIEIVNSVIHSCNLHEAVENIQPYFTRVLDQCQSAS